MDFNIQIQTIKSQIENMKLQIDNISMQNNNMFMMNAPIGGQLINLSMQMLNAGIQTFNIGKSIMMNMNMDNFYEQLKKVSEQINTMINEYNVQQQQMIMQQQQMMMQQLMHENQNYQNQENNNNKPNYINIRFEHISGKNLTMVFKYGTKVKEALNQYIARTYGNQNYKISFWYNAGKINENELRCVEDFFNNNARIQVLEEQILLSKFS